jgi:hypothetical protein
MRRLITLFLVVIEIFIVLGLTFLYLRGYDSKIINIQIGSNQMQDPPILVNKIALDYWLMRLGYLKPYVNVTFSGENESVPVKNITVKFTDIVQEDGTQTFWGDGSLASSANWGYVKSNEELDLTIEVLRPEKEGEWEYARSLEYALLSYLSIINPHSNGVDNVDVWQKKFSENNLYLRFLMLKPRIVIR